MSRKIIHIDMDAFYASVEQRDNPELRGKPVAVGGSPNGRGVVAAASYEARKFGIHSAMSARRAKEKCPQLIFVRSRFSVYREASQKFHRILKEATDLYEPLALDEAYLDVTENKLNEPSAYRIAMYLRARIRGQLKLTASAGVAPNKFIAKVASEMGKPNGLVVVPPERVSSFVANLPVKQLWGVGPKTAQKLHAQGIHTTADIRRLGIEGALRRFGKSGNFIYDLAHGKDERRVCPVRKAKSRSAETTFPEDILDLRELRKTLEQLAERICHPLEVRQILACGISLKVRYHNFETITRSCSLSPPSYDPARVSERLLKLLEDTEAGKRPVRLIGAKVERFTSLAPSPQLEMVEILRGIES